MNNYENKKETVRGLEKTKKIVCVIAIACMVLAMTACGKECANGCGKNANPDCMADMCDNCCAYWMGLNGCYSQH